MNLFRLLLFLAIAWIVWRLVQTALRAAGRQAPTPRTPDNYEPMARCARCGTYLPASSLSRDGRCGRCSE